MPDASGIELRPSDIRRFMQKARVDGPHSCWPWRGRIDEYGKFKVRGSTIRAHRVSYMLMRGPIGDGLVVRHKCDNPGCVNPKHLITGTHKDNTDDMWARGRGRGAPMDEAECLDLLRRFQARAGTAEEFARDLGVSRRSLHRYVRMAKERLSGVPWRELRVSQSVEQLPNKAEAA